MKLGVLGQAANGKGLVGKSEKGLKSDGKGEGPEGASKGEALTEDGGLLAGVGYNTQDRRTSRKNVAERANLERFLKEMDGEDAGETGKAQANDQGPEAKKDEAKPKTEAKEAREAKEQGPEQNRAEAKREGPEDGRVQGQAEAQEAAEAHEAKEPQEAEAEHQGGGRGQDEEDERDKPGGAWVAEELEDKSDKDNVALKSPDALADAHRCRGSLEDGSRCLRRVVKGSHYCREHFVPTIPPRKA